MDESRRTALGALAHVDPATREEAFAQARAAATDQDREVRSAAAQAVAATGLPSESLAALARLAADDDVGVRLAAVIALAGVPWRGRLELLARALRDADLGVVAVAADGLAHAGDRRAAETLLSLLGESRLRFGALEALLDLDPKLLETLSRKLFHAFLVPPFERALAAVVLAGLGDEASREHLRSKLAKERAEERPFVLVHLARVDPVEGRRAVETIANDEANYLRESALLALVKLDKSWWPRAQEAVERQVYADPHVAGELLLGLFDVDWERTATLAKPYEAREGELGAAARQIRLGTALRRAAREELLLRCD